MRVVIGTLALVHPGGTETYCLTVARALDRLGHDVTLFADELGPLADRATEGGFDVARELAELPAACEAVLANDAISAGLLAERYPTTRLVYCLHSSVFDVQLPPLVPGLLDAIVAPSERLAARARALALDVPVVRLTQPIDTERFAPSAPPRSPPQRALVVSSYLQGGRRDALFETWKAAGIECAQVGALDDVSFDVGSEMAKADIVVGKARAALEGMACGKAVYVFDAFGGDGWVTRENFPALEADNFAGLATEGTIDRRGLAADLALYDPDMGWTNRELVLRHHGAGLHAQGLVEILRGPPPRRRDAPHGSAATARMVRFAWRTQQRAASQQHEALELRARVNDLTARVGEAERETHLAQGDASVASESVRALSDELGAWQARAGEAERQFNAWQTRAVNSERELDVWQARAAEAERQLRAALELLSTRRVRAARAFGRGLDRVRGRP